jgi:hypothetical protein
MNSSSQPRAVAAAAAMPLATSRPASPVQAFAQPLLTTAPAQRPLARLRFSRETMIGAAVALFVVNTAAAGTGPLVEEIRQRSRGLVAGFGFLMPQYTPAATKPAGVVTPPSINLVCMSGNPGA